MTDGRFNRPATAESFQQAGHEFEARYRHVQQLVRARKKWVPPATDCFG